MASDNKSSKVLKNASWIIVCRIAQSVLSLLVGMLTARYLGPSNYGVINYAASIVAFAAPIMQLGLCNILVQEFVEDDKHEGEILGTSLIMSLSSALVCVIGVTAFAFVANAGEPETVKVCFLYSLMLFFQAMELAMYWFQAKYLSKYTSIAMFCSYAIVSAYKIFLLITEKSIYWFALSNALDYMIIAIAMIAMYRIKGGQNLRFSFDRAKKLFAKGKYYIVSSMMVTIFAQTDKIMLKAMIDETATGYYSAAITCAGITAFVFGAIIDSVRPLIFENKKRDTASYEKAVIQLYSVIIYLSLLQSLAMTILAGLIIRILYGVQYLASVPALQVVVWYTTFAYIGSVRNIWILAEGKQKYLWIINLSGALVNVLLNYVLIQTWGMIGAAAASLLTQIFTNVIIGYLIVPIQRNNRLMLSACNPKVVCGMLLDMKTRFRRKSA